MDHAMVWITQNGYMYYDFFQTTTKTQILVALAGAINDKYLFKKPPLNSNDNSFLYIYVTVFMFHLKIYKP